MTRRVKCLSCLGLLAVEEAGPTVSPLIVRIRCEIEAGKSTLARVLDPEPEALREAGYRPTAPDPASLEDLGLRIDPPAE